jgi:hypothetical protein
VALARDGESAQADIATFQRRIHSLIATSGLECVSAEVGPAHDEKTRLAAGFRVSSALFS